MTILVRLGNNNEGPGLRNDIGMVGRSTHYIRFRRLPRSLACAYGLSDDCTGRFTITIPPTLRVLESHAVRKLDGLNCARRVVLKTVSGSASPYYTRSSRLVSFLAVLALRFRRSPANNDATGATVPIRIFGVQQHEITKTKGAI